MAAIIKEELQAAGQVKALLHTPSGGFSTAIIPGMTWLPNSLRGRPGHTDRHFISTASFVKTTLDDVLPTEKLGCHETETYISS